MNDLNWKSGGRAAFWVAIAALALSASWRIYASVHLSAEHFTSGGPYTVWSIERLYDKAGVLKFAYPFVQAVRSDGAKMTRMTAANLQERNIYLADGSYVRANDWSGRKTTYPKPLPEMLPVFRDPQASCVSAVDSKVGAALEGRETIDGHPAARIMFVKGGKRAWTSWYALDLGCAEVQMRLGHETGVTERKVERVILGEPDPKLFEVSEALEEMAPSQYYTLCPDAGPCKSLPPAVAAKLDKNYHATRAE